MINRLFFYYILKFNSVVNNFNYDRIKYEGNS